MKSILVTVLVSFGVSAWAAGELHCRSEIAKKVVSTSAKDHNEFLEYCDTAIFHGEICYTGPRADAIGKLDWIASTDIFGGEYAIQNIHYVGRSEISYQIWDGPNEVEATKARIGRCESGFFKK
ncbi:MAG: hypothetical protein AB7F86_00480 [Bdellovibrionales bacterium]